MKLEAIMLFGSKMECFGGNCFDTLPRNWQVGQNRQEVTMDHVNFVAMKDGTKEDYQLLTEREVENTKGTADRLLHALEHLDEALAGYKIMCLGHSLQFAT